MNQDNCMCKLCIQIHDILSRASTFETEDVIPELKLDLFSLCTGSQVQSSNNSQVPYLTLPTLLQQTCRPSQYPTHHIQCLHVYPFASIGHPLSFAQYLGMESISMFVEHGCKNFACIPFAQVLTFYVLICFQPIPDCIVVLIVLHLDMPLQTITTSFSYCIQGHNEPQHVNMSSKKITFNFDFCSSSIKTLFRLPKAFSTTH